MDDIMTFEQFVENFYGKKNNLIAVSALKREHPDIYNQYAQRCKRVDLWRQRKNAKPITPENFEESEQQANFYFSLSMGGDF